MHRVVKHLTSGTVALVISFAVAAANATFAAVCPVNVASKVTQADHMTPVSGCELGSVNDDAQAPVQVNVDEMFGHSDWVLLEQAEYPMGVRQGDWQLPDAETFWDTYDRALIVLKGGFNGSTPEYVGYFVTEPDGTGGHWVTPSTLVSLQHISYYGHEVGTTPVSTVPLPSALPLFLTALMGIGIIARRKRRAA
jgi:hypothetical protein